MSSISYELIPKNKTYESKFAESALRLMPKISEIPGEYISHLIIYYFNGDQTLIKGETIRNTVPVTEMAMNHLFNSHKLSVKNIKIYLDIESIEEDVESIVDQIFKIN